MCVHAKSCAYESKDEQVFRVAWHGGIEVGACQNALALRDSSPPSPRCLAQHGALLVLELLCVCAVSSLRSLWAQRPQVLLGRLPPSALGQLSQERVPLQIEDVLLLLRDGYLQLLCLVRANRAHVLLKGVSAGPLDKLSQA